jgi:hypothetical protein
MFAMKLKNLIMVSAASALLIGCANTKQTHNPKSEGENVNTPGKKGGAQLWAARCTQCHFARDPGTFSPEQWEIIMFHMRIRANLTAWETDSILEFLKSAN